MAPIIQFIQHGDIDGIDNPIMRRKASRFTLVGEELYKRDFSNPLLRCVTNYQAQYIMEELHMRICGLHSGSQTMAARVLQAGYYWPIVKEDCEKYVRKCTQCQQHGNMIHLKSEELHGITSPWPFAKWGMDPRALQPRERSGKVPVGGYRLLHQVD